MSWAAYLDTLKSPDRSGNVPVMEAAICGIGSGQESVWASTPGLAGITVDEIKKLVHERKNFSQVGAYVAGRKCMMLQDRIDMEGVYTLEMKTAKDADGNTFGVCVGKSNMALIIAMGTKDASGGQLTSKVYEVVKYLRENNM